MSKQWTRKARSWHGEEIPPNVKRPGISETLPEKVHDSSLRFIESVDGDRDLGSEIEGDSRSISVLADPAISRPNTCPAQSAEVIERQAPRATQLSIDDTHKTYEYRCIVNICRGNVNKNPVSEIDSDREICRLES